MKTPIPLADPESVLNILSKISFLGGIPEQKRDRVIGYFETATYKKGEFIAERGEEPTHIFIIKSGEVGLFIEDGGDCINKRTFTVGDCFGEAAMLSLINNTASFAATEDSELITFSRKSFNRLRVQDPELFCQLILNLARDLARKLQYTDELMLHPRGHTETTNH